MQLPDSRLRLEAEALFGYGSAAASMRLLWRYKLLDVLLPHLAERFAKGKLPRCASMLINYSGWGASPRPRLTCRRFTPQRMTLRQEVQSQTPQRVAQCREPTHCSSARQRSSVTCLFSDDTSGTVQAVNEILQRASSRDQHRFCLPEIQILLARNRLRNFHSIAKIPKSNHPYLVQSDQH